MKTLQRITLIVIFLLGAKIQAEAGTGISADIFYSYDSNTFRNYMALEDKIAQATLYFNRNFETDNNLLRFYYTGNFYGFQNFVDRNFLFNQLGVALSHSTSSDGNFFFAGLQFSNRLNKELYNYYDFKQILAYANVKYHVAAYFLQGGYRLRGRSYQNLDGFSYWEHRIFLRVNRSFKTRTSVTAETNFGLKNYIARTYTTTAYDNSFFGPGAGWMGKHGALAQTQEIVEDVPSAKMLVTSLRIGQSLMSTTGLSGQILYRYNFNSEARYLAAVQSGYSTEDELFDDPYSYKGIEYSVALTQIFPKGIQGTFSYTVTDKFYPGHLALDLDGNAIDGSYRSDRLKYFYAGLEKSFSMKHWVSSMSIFLDYYRMANQSNDLYYIYRRSLVSAGFTLNY